MPADLPTTRGPVALTPQLRDTGVVAILRSGAPDHLESVAHTLAESGITCLELTLTTPGALPSLARLRAALPDAVALGVGSVITAAQATAALAAGAGFLVSPGVCPAVAREAAAHGVACYPGGWTPTEIIEAWDLGVPAVKLFPAASGGPRHLKNLRGPLPDIPLIPTGGVGLDADHRVRCRRGGGGRPRRSADRRCAGRRIAGGPALASRRRARRRRRRAAPLMTGRASR